MTYIDSSGGFGALGHGISDETTAGLLTIHDGRLYKTKIVSIIKGTEGTPGEFIGTIDYQEKNFLGSIRKIRSVAFLARWTKIWQRSMNWNICRSVTAMR